MQDRNAQVWTGLQQGGIAKYDEKTQKLEYLNQPEKISNRNIFGILEDNQQHLWLSSDNGLLKVLSAAEPVAALYQSAMASPAMHLITIPSSRTAKESSIFGGFNGITHFSPDEILPPI
jgi:ligand-binding sensor domain-containing protein